ncbi:BQ5605_C006g04151 [Microbotryum silenes-dioicae]|uniref:Prefoldin subunit 3 n=1 Tax=Microbotryum silenes-dioicae TaxID=796604 RepID=A0A2X0P8Q3_9BASI|nr:BQ5605_C006g04151 [Microbotryum silenes-dioicae]
MPAQPQPQLQPQAMNARGFPKADFIEDVDAFIVGTDPDQSLQQLQETLAEYRFMENNKRQRRQGLEEKVPELQRTLAMIETLQRKKDAEQSFDTTFELSDTLYATGCVQHVDEVYVWLGANTMLSYPPSAALSLLSEKLITAQASLQNVREDLDWLREQITITEVNVARVYNWDVKRRREIR